MSNIRLGNAGENCSEEVSAFFGRFGLKIEHSPSYASQFNEPSEIIIQELWNVPRKMLYEVWVNIRLWSTTVYPPICYETDFQHSASTYMCLTQMD